MSKREHGDVGEYERQYEHGTDPRVLDIIDVPVVRACPKDYHTESWLLDDGHYWENQGKYPSLDLNRLTDPWHRFGWMGIAPTTVAMTVCPCRPSGSRRRCAYSALIDWNLRCAPGEAFGNSKRRVQGAFPTRDADTRSVTDPTYERRYLGKINGEYQLGACYLAVSLGEPYNNACYKLVAAIIEAET